MVSRPGFVGRPKSVDGTRSKWTPVEPAGTCPGHESLKLGGSEDPWTTGARDECSTIGGGNLARSCRVGGRGDRPDVPQRLRAASADGRGHSRILAQAQGPAVRLDDRGGADDRGIHSQYRGIRSARRRRSGELRQATAQGRGHPAISAAFRGRRRRALCWQGAGEGAGDAHGAAPRAGPPEQPIRGSWNPPRWSTTIISTASIRTSGRSS